MELPLPLPALGVFLGRRSEKGKQVSTTEGEREIPKDGRTLVNVGKDTTLGDGNVTQELVQLLIVTDGELEVTRNDTGLLVVTGGVTGQLENFSSQVLEDGSQVDGSTGTDTLSVVALAEQTVDTTNGEGQTSLGGTAMEGTRLESKGDRPKKDKR